MKSINRTAILVTPREPFLAWARAIDADSPAAVAGTDFTSIYLVHESDEYDPQGLINEYYDAIFEELLYSWHRDERKWPASRTESMFHEWFDAKVIDMVWDMGQDRIIAED